MTGSTLAERLQWILDNRQFENPTDLSKRAGLADNYIGLLISGQRGKQGLRPGTAERIAEVAQVRAEWLLMGKGDPVSDEAPDAKAAAPRTVAPAGGYPRRQQAIALLAKIIHPNALKALACEDFGHDLTLQQWVDRGHELDRMALRAEREAERARKEDG